MWNQIVFIGSLLRLSVDRTHRLLTRRYVLSMTPPSFQQALYALACQASNDSPRRHEVQDHPQPPRRTHPSSASRLPFVTRRRGIRAWTFRSTAIPRDARRTSSRRRWPPDRERSDCCRESCETSWEG